MEEMIEREDVRAELARLVYEFPPRRIMNEAQLDQTQERVDVLLGRPRTAAQEIYLDLLGRLIYEWEEEHEQVPDIYGTALVRVLLQERQMPQRELVRAGIFATDSVASEVLAGRRPFGLEQILAVARFFGVAPAAFLPERGRVPA